MPLSFYPSSHLFSFCCFLLALFSSLFKCCTFADWYQRGKFDLMILFRMASQYFIYCFSLIAFLPSNCAQPSLALLAYLTQIDFVEFSGTGGGPFIFLFPDVLSIFIFAFQAFVLNSSQMLSLSSLDLLSRYSSGCNFFICYQQPNLNHANLSLIWFV